MNLKQFSIATRRQSQQIKKHNFPQLSHRSCHIKALKKHQFKKIAFISVDNTFNKITPEKVTVPLKYSLLVNGSQNHLLWKRSVCQISTRLLKKIAFMKEASE